jgi:hypothetical protein
MAARIYFHVSMSRPISRKEMNLKSGSTIRLTVVATKMISVATASWVMAGAVGAEYAEPPSWDPMLMLNVKLDANKNVSVETTSVIIRLQPAPRCYNPSTQSYDSRVISFDPAARWAVLNGTAYSRVLGWYDEGTTGANGDNFYDTYARELAGNYLWIEKTGGSPELKTYAISEAGDPTAPYTPIFGTDGSPTRWRWDGFMAHNVNAVALTALTASNQVFTATYRLYVGDAAGNPVAGYGETDTTWTWQGPAVPFKPELKIQSRVVVEWPAGLAPYVLEMAESGASSPWVSLVDSTRVLGGKKVVILDASAAGCQFRLRLVP